MKKKIYSLLSFVNPILQRKFDERLRVLAYHTVVDKKSFEIQLKYLKAHYNILSLLQLQEHLKNNTLPKKSLVITFDDGDRSVFEYGLPLLTKYKLPSTSFVITGLIGTSQLFWCRWVEEFYQKEGESYLDARKKIKELKDEPNKSRMDYLRKIPFIKGEQLSSDELHISEDKKMFIGNHTHFHPMLDRCTAKEIEEELRLSKGKFEDWNLKGYPVFAYPNGNWDKKSEEILKEKGIKMAFLFDHKINKKKINPMRISRIRVDADLGLKEFKVKVSGLHSIIMHSKNYLTGKKK